ncbi:Digeranylgeranylglycerophospholipid reductase [Trichinella spiralis]|uniref:Digeranylgeranylglycerophospholipid reductase n=1 Tax=Trichinella spiralis TaxID=6334 RepID=A0ABR3K960_TRISP
MIRIVKGITFILLFCSNSFAYGDSSVPKRFEYNGKPLSDSAVNILAFDMVTMDLTSQSYFNGIVLLQSDQLNDCLKLHYFSKWLKKYGDPIMLSDEYKSIRQEILDFYKQEFTKNHVFSIPYLEECKNATDAFLEILIRTGNFYNFVI